MKKILTALIALALLTGTAFSASSNIAKPVALFETTLASRIASTDSTMTLTSALTKDGSTLATSTYGFIIDEGTASEEFVMADCVATACTNLTRGVSVLNGTSSVTALKKEHRRGASVKITDAPLLIQLYNIVTGLQDFIFSNATTSNLVVNGDINLASGYKLKLNSTNLAYGSTTKYNFFFGPSGNTTMTGSYNNALGSGALTSNTGGSGNTAIGDNAGHSNENGQYNTVIGYNSMDDNGLLGSGSNNTAVGAETLGAITNDSGNVALGYYAGRYETGSNSFYLNNQDRTNISGDKTLSLLYGTFAAATSSQQLTVNGALNLTGAPTWNGTPTADKHLATKDYVDGVVTGGAADANETTKGLVEIATNVEAASSTSLGGTLARLALPASMATSSSQVAQHSVVVTNSSGKMDSSFFSNSTTTFASSTFVGSTYALDIGKHLVWVTSSTTWAVPSGIKTVWVEAVGGGGRGGVGDPTLGQASGGGGGAGAYCAGFVDVSATSSIRINIGGGDIGSGAGSTTFSTFINAGPGLVGSGSMGNSGGNCDGSVTNLVRLENQDGENGYSLSNDRFSGRGANTPFGTGGQSVIVTGADTNGIAGKGYGTGGSGAVNEIGGSTPAGGSGANGLVIIKY